MRQDPAISEAPGLAEYETEAELARVPVRMMRFCWRNRHATIPLSMPFCLLAAAEAMRHHPEPLWAEASVAALASVTVWNAAARKWSTTPRIKDLAWTSEVAYARATVVAGSAWLLFAARYGPLTPTLEWLLGLGCAAWGIPFFLHKRPRGKRERKRHLAEVARWNQWWLSHAPAWGLAVRHAPVTAEDGSPLPARVSGSYVVDFKDHGGLTSLLIQLWKGRQTHADVKRILPLIESALGGYDAGGGYVAHGMTRCEVNKADPSQVWLHLKRADPLREVIEWDPAMTPADICQPAPLGVRESGEWLRRCLLASFFVLGRSRSGKSNEQSVMLSTITGCRNARALLIDMKGGRAARPWLPAVDWLATTTDEADLMLRCVMAEVKGRGTYAYNGEEQLVPTAEVPALFLVIDETYEVTSAMSGSPGAARRAGWLATIASQGQGLAIYVIIVTQYGALEESVGTEQTRMNLNGRLCFQTEHRDHGEFALGDDVSRLGIDTTKLREKGTFYYRADSESIAEQIRGPHIPHGEVRRIAMRNAERTGLHSRPLALYASDWQHTYDTRWERLPEQFRADAPQAAHLAPPSPAGAVMPSSKINISEEPDSVDAQIAAINAEVDELPVTDDDIARARARREARGAPPLDLESDFERSKRRFAVLLQGATQADPISPAQLRRGAGTSESWVHLTLGKLAEDGHVIKVGRARYAPAAGADILAALDVIKREGDRLARQARDLVGAGAGDAP
jgi:hypothetical protein